jgi:hypothetical protein
MKLRRDVLLIESTQFLEYFLRTYLGVRPFCPHCVRHVVLLTPLEFCVFLFIRRLIADH